MISFEKHKYKTEYKETKELENTLQCKRKKRKKENKHPNPYLNNTKRGANFEPLAEKGISNTQ